MQIAHKSDQAEDLETQTCRINYIWPVLGRIMTNSMQSEWIKEAYNGGGWENSIKISSFDEFRNALLDLGASISFNEEFQGLTHAVAHVDGRLYF